MSTTDTEFLNVDDIQTKINKTISVKGIKHKFHAPTIGEFMAEMQHVRKLQEKLKNGENIDQTTVVEVMTQNAVRMVASSFPTLSEEDLNDLNHAQIKAIQAFVATQIEEESENAEDASGNV